MRKNKKWTLTDINNLELDLLNDGVMSISYKGSSPRIMKRTIRMKSVPCKIIFEYSNETNSEKNKEWMEYIDKKFKKVYERLNKRNQNILKT
ncbi:MAG TPA: hypothetical protein PLG90_13390 [Ignavibacteria bacterium]|nr:hypothetical protein [Ignavibacteria bacterium]